MGIGKDIEYFVGHAPDGYFIVAMLRGRMSLHEYMCDAQKDLNTITSDQILAMCQYLEELVIWSYI